MTAIVALGAGRMGRGIAHAEGRAEWHHKSRLNAEDIEAMLIAVEQG